MPPRNTVRPRQVRSARAGRRAMPQRELVRRSGLCPGCGPVPWQELLGWRAMRPPRRHLPEGKALERPRMRRRRAGVRGRLGVERKAVRAPLQLLPSRICVEWGDMPAPSGSLSRRHVVERPSMREGRNPCRLSRRERVERPGLRRPRAERPMPARGRVGRQAVPRRAGEARVPERNRMERAAVREGGRAAGDRRVPGRLDVGREALRAGRCPGGPVPRWHGAGERAMRQGGGASGH